MLVDLLRLFFKWLTPPREGDSGEEHYRWRVSVSVVLGITAVGLILRTITSIGLVPALYPGYATTVDVAALAIEIRTARMQDLATKMLDLQPKRCSAVDENLRQVLTKELTEMQIEYRDKKGIDFPLPSCNELREQRQNERNEHQ